MMNAVLAEELQSEYLCIIIDVIESLQPNTIYMQQHHSPLQSARWKLEQLIATCIPSCYYILYKVFK